MTIAVREPLTEQLLSRFGELTWPAAAAACLARANVQAWVVGGFIRDAALGRPSGDLDVAVDGDPFALAPAIAETLGGHLVPLDRKRGIVRIALAGGATLDLAALRGGSIETDLDERDFTIDAIAVPLTPAAGKPIDPHGVLADLARRRLRLVAEGAFRSDGLRLLRAARLASELDLSFDGVPLSRAHADAGAIAGVAPERQRDELLRMCASDRAARGLRMLDRMGVLERVLPDVTAARGVKQPPEHYYDVFDHSIEAVAALDALLARGAAAGRAVERLRVEFWERLDPIADLRAYFDGGGAGRSRLALTKLGALLHDIAKPQTKATDAGGRIRFYGHPEQGAERTAAILTGLRFSGHDVAFARPLVREHLRPTQLSDGGPPTARALARYFRDLGEAALAVLVLSLADHVAARGPRLDAREFSSNLVYIAYLLDRQRRLRAAAPPVRLLTGDDLMAELHLPPGPIVGRILRTIEEAQSAGEIGTRQQALDVARDALAAG